MQKLQQYVLASAGFLSVFQTAIAANLVVNGSFESYSGAFGTDNAAILFPGATMLTSWVVFGGDVDVIRVPNPYSLTPSDGTNFVDLTGSSDAGGAKGLSQIVSGFAVGSVYTLSFDLGIRNGFCSLGNDCVGPIQASASIAGVSQSFTYNSATPGNNWGTFGFTFVATNGSLPLTLTGLSGFRYIGLDNISVSVVPEPAVLIYLLAGLPLLACAARRGRQPTKRQ